MAGHIVDGSNDGGAPLIGGRGGGDMVVVEGMVDYKGKKAVGSKTGGWRSAGFIIGVEIAERFAFNGISSNLITYLTGPLRQSTASAAVNVNAWNSAVYMLPLLGAFLADSYLGRYRMILFASLLYLMGLGLLTLLALLHSLSLIICQDSGNNINSCSPPQYQVILFFISLYIVALAQGGHKPCTQAFGADQFNPQDPEESKSRRSFFNWWVFGLCWGMLFSFSIVTYIQDNMNWALGFGIPWISMGIALGVFLMGTKTYRYSVKDDEGNPFTKIGVVFVLAARNWRCTLPLSDIEGEAIERTHQFQFLDKALIDISDDQNIVKKDKTVCCVSQVNNAKTILQLIPIWCASLMYGTACAQGSTFFTKQGSTMERSLGPSFQVPPASLLAFMSLSIVIFTAIYDRFIVPTATVFTNKPSGITMLQRIGFGMILSIITMLVAALVERKRLQVARDFSLIDVPGAVVPMSIWWLLPQYCLTGVSDVFTMIGMQEFFYDQVPNELKSFGIALYWSTFGVGSFLSGFLISVIENITSNGDGDSWFSDNLNRGHLDYFFLLLAGLSTIGFITYVHLARSYVYNRKNST